MGYYYLAAAILAEVTATSALKASNEFTRLFPSLVVIVGYSAAFYFMTLTLRSIPLGITYAVWSGLGIVLITIVGAIFYKQIPDLATVIGILFIVVGICIIHLFSKNLSH